MLHRLSDAPSNIVDKAAIASLAADDDHERVKTVGEAFCDFHAVCSYTSLAPGTWRLAQAAPWPCTPAAPPVLPPACVCTGRHR